MADKFSFNRPGLASPAENAAAITLDDNNDLATFCRMIYVGGAGDVKLTTVNGDTVTFKAVPVGTTLQVRAKRVFSTGTSGSLLLALW